MFIYMTKEELLVLADFLNRKYEERRQEWLARGRRYSITRFAVDLKINQPTLSRLMKLGPEKKIVEGIDTPILIALWDVYKDELMDALRVDANITRQKQKEKKSKRKAAGAGG